MVFSDSSFSPHMTRWKTHNRSISSQAEAVELRDAAMALLERVGLANKQAHIRLSSPVVSNSVSRSAILARRQLMRFDEPTSATPSLSAEVLTVMRALGSLGHGHGRRNA